MSKLDARSEILGRARRVLDQTKPMVERLVEEAKPRIGDAARGAVRYAKDHDQEIKGVAMALVRSRTAGPWRLAATALGGVVASRVLQKDDPACGNCGTAATSRANFCVECGARLETAG